MSEQNTYDKKDMVRLHSVIHAEGLKLACYSVRDPETGAFSAKQFHMTYGNTVMAVMSESAAKLFSHFVRHELGLPAFEPAPAETEA